MSESDVALVTALAWPAVVFWLALLYRDPLARLLDELPRRVKSLSVAGVSVTLADVAPVELGQSRAPVDLRHGGASQDINDSTLHSFLEQLRDPAPMAHAVVDLGNGREWLSSRLYVLSVVLARMRSLRTLVFVEAATDRRRQLIGLCPCDAVRWSLAMRWPVYEASLAGAASRVWGPPGPFLEPPAAASAEVVNRDGRLEQFHEPGPAIELLRDFLSGIQQPVLPGDAAPPQGWVRLPANPQNPAGPRMQECARWLDGALLEDLLGGALQRQRIAEPDLAAWSDAQGLRAVVRSAGDWVPVIGADGRFERLIDRRATLVAIAEQCQAATGNGS